LPAKPLVDLDVRDRSPRNVGLAERSLAGLKEAGVAVGDQPNVVLHVSTSRLGGTAGESAARGCQGAVQVLPSTAFGGTLAARQPPLLFSASLRPREP